MILPRIINNQPRGAVMRFIAKVLSAVIPLTFILSAPVQARDWNTIKASGTIIAVTEGQYAPFNYY